MSTPRSVNLGAVLGSVPKTVPRSAPRRINYTTPSYSQGFETIDGINWYYFLVPGQDRSTWLMKEIGETQILQMFVVCANLPGSSIPPEKGEKAKVTHMFAAFESYLDFLNYARKIAMDKWYFFEVILGGRPQKLYFDIDIHPSDVSGDLQVFADNLLTYLIGRTLFVFNRRGIDLDISKHILLFSSNPPSEGIPEKISFHIIVDSVAVANNDENCALATEIFEGSPPEYRQFFDESMYSSKQQFRLYRSMKPYSNRPKLFVNEWKYNNQLIKYEYPDIPAPDEIAREAVQFTTLFSSSCVTVTERCRLIVINPGQERPSSTHDYSDATISREMMASITDQLPKWVLDIYQISEFTGPWVILRRRKRAECIICGRAHDNENAFLSVSRFGKVYFHCRRNDEQSKLVADVSHLVENEFSAELKSQQLQSVLSQMKQKGLAFNPITATQLQQREKEKAVRRPLNIPVLSKEGYLVVPVSTPTPSSEVKDEEEEIIIELSPSDTSPPSPLFTIPKPVLSSTPIQPKVPFRQVGLVYKGFNGPLNKEPPDLVKPHERLRQLKFTN